MATEIHITEEGYKSMLTKGLSSAITQYSVNDQYKIYGLDSLATLPSLTGTKTNLGNGNPALNLAGYKGIPKNPISEEVSAVLNKRIGIKFFSSDCNGGFDLNGLNVKFHVNRYFSFLESFLTQDYNFSHDGLTQTIYDYVYGVVEEEDIVNGGYNTLDNVQQLDIRTKFTSVTDKNNYKSFNNRYVDINTILQDNRGATVFPSPFHLNFTSYNAGISVPGSTLKLTMAPDFYGYTIDGVFYTLTDANNLITSNGTNSFTTIIPTAKLKGVDYYMEDSNNYNTTDPLLGNMVYGFKNGAKTQTLLEGLIERGRLYMETKGTLTEGTYNLPINYKVDIFGNDEFNSIYQNNNYGGGVNIEFIYDSTDVTTTNIIEVS